MILKKIIKNKWFIYSNLSVIRAIIKLLNRNTKLVLEQLPVIIGAVLKNIKLKMGFRTVGVKFTSQQWALGPARSLAMTRRGNGARRFPVQSCWAGLI